MGYGPFSKAITSLYENDKWAWNHASSCSAKLSVPGVTYKLSVAIDNNGNAGIVWYHVFDSIYYLFKSEYRKDEDGNILENWNPATEINDHFNTTLPPPSAAISYSIVRGGTEGHINSGEAIIVWTIPSGVYFRHYRNNSWSVEQLISGSSSLLVSATMNTSGKAIIIWPQPINGVIAGMSMFDPETEAWTHPYDDVNNYYTQYYHVFGPRYVSNSTIKLLDNNDIIIQWFSDMTMKRSEYRNGAWVRTHEEVPTTGDSDGVSADTVKLAANNTDNAIIVWAQRESSRDDQGSVGPLQIFFSQYFEPVQ